MGGVLEWVVCLRGWRASVGSIGGMLTWVTWLACKRGRRASVGDVGGLCLCVYACFISIWRNIALYRYIV